MDWITVEDGTTVTTDAATLDEDEYMYWLYSGSVQVERDNRTLYNMSRNGTATRQHAGQFLLGEGRLLRRMQKMQQQNHPVDQSVTTVRSSGPSTTLLRIHTKRLKLLMDHQDQSLADSIRTLVFSGMEAKWNAQLRD